MVPWTLIGAYNLVRMGPGISQHLHTKHYVPSSHEQDIEIIGSGESCRPMEMQFRDQSLSQFVVGQIGVKLRGVGCDGNRGLLLTHVV